MFSCLNCCFVYTHCITYKKKKTFIYLSFSFSVRNDSPIGNQSVGMLVICIPVRTELVH